MISNQWLKHGWLIGLSSVLLLMSCKHFHCMSALLCFDVDVMEQERDLFDYKIN